MTAETEARFLTGAQDGWHAIDATSIAPGCTVHAWSLCGSIVRIARNDGDGVRPYDFTAYPVAFDRCQVCLWAFAARTDALEGALGLLTDPLARDTAAAILNECGRDDRDPEERDIQLLAAVGRHAPVRLVSEECGEGDCDHGEGSCPGNPACRACSLQAGFWADEWEGHYREECTIPAPCGPLLALAHHFGVTP